MADDRDVRALADKLLASWDVGSVVARMAATSEEVARKTLETPGVPVGAETFVQGDIIPAGLRRAVMGDKTCRRGVKAAGPQAVMTVVKVRSRGLGLVPGRPPCQERACSPAASHVGGAW